VGVDTVHRDAQELDVALAELVRPLGQLGYLGRADGSEIGGVGEH
jgi:hypothetical protein